MLEDRSKVSGEFLFFNNQMVLRVVFNEFEIPESLHEHADSRTGGAHHCGQLLMRNPDLDAYAPWVFLAEFSRDLEQRLSKALLAVNRHQVRDDLLLVGHPHCQISDKPFEERVALQPFEEFVARDFFEECLFHRSRGLEPPAESRQTQLAKN